MTLFIHDLDGQTLAELKEKEFSINETVSCPLDGSDVYLVFIYNINSMLTVPGMVSIPGMSGIALMDNAGHYIILSDDAYHIIEVK